MRPNFGGEALTPTSPGPPFSALHSGKQISDIENLTLSQNQPAETLSEAQAGLLSPFNPLKRGAAETTGIPDLSPDQSIGNKISGSRRTKALSGEAFTSKDPDFDREGSHANEPEFQRGRVGSIKRLFDPHTDNPSPTHTNRRSKLQEPADGPRRTHDRKSHVFRSRKSPSADKDDFERKIIFNKGVEDPPNLERLLNQPSKLDRALSARQDEPDMVGANLDNDWEPEILLQPETRPISHEQLLVEVKGIYAGLVMVEAKCIEVDEEQSQRAREKDPSRQTRLSNEQWQALIALHKTLLHEHHDFFLASQHPSASPALSRLAAKYTMPARMWRHGIHAFLEVLRHRLPGSLDHMLAFIYIAYSMVALLYETVSTFEDTWIECLGDLGRYRMAIEDDDIRDREVWSGVARFWYSKAADKTPDVGRLYHHLAILARPYTLQQLSLYTRSLTCENPFESARGSIMTLFTPILNGKESAHHRSSSFETILIKAHGILFSGKSQSVFSSTVDQLIGGGILDNYIGRVTAKFREQGVFVAVANIAALFEYGGSVKQSSSPVSILRPAFKGLRDAEARARSKAESEAGAELDVKVKAEGKVLSSEKPKEEVEKLLESAFDINEITLRSSSFSCQSALESLTPSDLDSSISMINHASKLAFGTLSTCLQRIGDKNVLPIISVYFIFIFDLTRVEDVPPHLEKRLPWAEMCSFLNYLAKPENLTARVRSKHFPIPNYLGNRPLPEDFVMRGQWFFPQDRFSKATVDDEERSIELSDMVASRVERILWLGLRMASVCLTSTGKSISLIRKSPRVINGFFSIKLLGNSQPKNAIRAETKRPNILIMSCRMLQITTTWLDRKLAGSQSPRSIQPIILEETRWLKTRVKYRPRLTFL